MAGETGGTTDRLLNKLQYAAANKATTATLAAGDLVLVFDVSEDYVAKTTPAGTMLSAAAFALVTLTTGSTIATVENRVQAILAGLIAKGIMAAS